MDDNQQPERDDVRPDEMEPELDEREEDQEEAIDLGELYPDETDEGDGEAATGAAEAAEAVVASAEKVRAELDEVRQQWLRTLADFDNFRKRTEREQREQRRFALFDPMRELLPVVDNLERALSADGSVDDLKRGVEMILQQVVELMSRQGVQPVAAAGEPFDPNVHDAVSRFEDPEVDRPTIADELQRGYTLHDRLLRPALVRVAMPAHGDQVAAEAAVKADDED